MMWDLSSDYSIRLYEMASDLLFFPLSVSISSFKVSDRFDMNAKLQALGFG